MTQCTPAERVATAPPGVCMAGDRIPQPVQGTIAVGFRSVAGRSIRLLGGLWLFAAGLAMMVRAGLGLSAWDVLHDAIRSLTPLTFGQVVVVVSVAVLAASVALGVRLGLGTVANALLVGVFTDAMLRSSLLHDLPTGAFVPRLAVMVVGIWGIAFGTGLYISAKLGAGPRDALMLGVARRSGRSVGLARTVIEVAVLIVGVALGGSVGIGTACFVILIGPAIQVSFRVFRLEEPSKDKTSITPLKRTAHAIAAWGRRGQLGGSSSTDVSRETGARI
jgi:uncharacterized membrane protein YczE